MRNSYWDSAKGILILLVVIGHLMEQTAHLAAGCYYIWTIIYIFHMPAFILISGFLTKQSHRDPIERIPKYFVLYVITQYTAHILAYLTGRKDSWYGDLISPTMGAWYLLFLIYASIVAHFLKTRQINRNTWIAGAILVGLVSGFDSSITNQGGLSRFFSFFVFFLIGYFFDWNGIIQKLKKRKWVLGLGSALIIVILLYFQHEGVFLRKNLSGAIPYADLYKGATWKGLLVRGGLYLTSLFVVLSFLSFVPQRARLFMKLGKNSIYIYICHILLISYVFNFVIKLLQNTSERFQLIGGSLLVLIIIILISYIAFRFIELLKKKFSKTV